MGAPPAVTIQLPFRKLKSILMCAVHGDIRGSPARAVPIASGISATVRRAGPPGGRDRFRWLSGDRFSRLAGRNRLSRVERVESRWPRSRIARRGQLSEIPGGSDGTRTRDLRRDRPQSLKEKLAIATGHDIGPLHQRARTRAKVSWPNWSFGMYCIGRTGARDRGTGGGGTSLCVCPGPPTWRGGWGCSRNGVPASAKGTSPSRRRDRPTRLLSQPDQPTPRTSAEPDAAQPAAPQRERVASVLARVRRRRP
jgi:hypothetical protein